jgi:hypothetical protein
MRVCGPLDLSSLHHFLDFIEVSGLAHFFKLHTGPFFSNRNIDECVRPAVQPFS